MDDCQDTGEGISWTSIVISGWRWGVLSGKLECAKLNYIDSHTTWYLWVIVDRYGTWNRKGSCS